LGGRGFVGPSFTFARNRSRLVGTTSTTAHSLGSDVNGTKIRAVWDGSSSRGGHMTVAWRFIARSAMTPACVPEGTPEYGRSCVSRKSAFVKFSLEDTPLTHHRHYRSRRHLGGDPVRNRFTCPPIRRGIVLATEIRSSLRDEIKFQKYQYRR
ncbi:MAG: hypothetical protein QOE88_650, partial [Verrucomicrobiota bacterium]|nr:hypothetical protein [Verrucomicrobiota bacterium]